MPQHIFKPQTCFGTSGGTPKSIIHFEVSYKGAFFARHSDLLEEIYARPRAAFSAAIAASSSKSPWLNLLTNN